MNFVFLAFLICGDGDDNTSYQMIGAFKTQEDAINGVPKQYKQILGSSRTEYSRQNEDTWNRHYPPDTVLIERVEMGVIEHEW
jgi:hypothetical protein